MMDFSTWLAFAGASLLLSIAPGPDNLFVLAQSAMYGKKAGILVVLGLCTGLVVNTLLAALGLAALVAALPALFWAIKAAGAAYLVYLAVMAWRHARDGGGAAEGVRLSGVALWRRGVLMNLTNPKVQIFFLAFFPQFVKAGTTGWALGRADAPSGRHLHRGHGSGVRSDSLGRGRAGRQTAQSLISGLAEPGQCDPVPAPCRLHARKLTRLRPGDGRNATAWKRPHPTDGRGRRNGNTASAASPPPERPHGRPADGALPAGRHGTDALRAPSSRDGPEVSLETDSPETDSPETGGRRPSPPNGPSARPRGRRGKAVFNKVVFDELAPLKLFSDDTVM